MFLKPKQLDAVAEIVLCQMKTKLDFLVGTSGSCVLGLNRALHTSLGCLASVCTPCNSSLSFLPENVSFVTVKAEEFYSWYESFIVNMLVRPEKCILSYLALASSSLDLSKYQAFAVHLKCCLQPRADHALICRGAIQKGAVS